MARTTFVGYLRSTLALICACTFLIACGGAEGDGADSSETKDATDAAQSIRPGESGTIVPTAAAATVTSDFDSDDDGFMTRDEYCAGMAAVQSEFVFPAGYVFSAEDTCTRLTSPFPTEAVFENGGEYSAVGVPHMCAWATEWLQAFARSDQMTMTTAMEQLETVTLNLSSMRYVTEELQERFDAANLGDPSGLQALVEERCAPEMFVSTPVAHVMGIGRPV